MKVGDIMTQEVISVRADTAVAEAAKLMLEERVSGLPVLTSAGVLIGVVTEGDFLRRAEVKTEKKRPRWLELLVSPNTLAGEYVHNHSRVVGDVMTRDVVVATEDMPLDAAVDLMERKRVKRLPVVRDGRVVGIIARANLLHALAASPPQPEQKSDEAIRKALERELNKQSWSTRQLHFIVKDGVVDLWGCITADRQREAIRVAAENINGVKLVRDHLAWIEPYSGMLIATGTDDQAGMFRWV